MIPKALASITQSDLQELIANEVHEGKTIEYKRDLPGGSSEDRKEFLKDVSSFANADGGDLLFGVVEASGLPQSFPGIVVTDQDALRQNLENRLRDGLEPRLADVQFKFIPLDAGTHTLLVRMRKSWVAPHRVTLGGHGHFYSRNSAGAYPLSVGELRSSFLHAQTIEDRIRSFRRDRVADIAAGETPVRLLRGATYVLHVVPLSAFVSRDLIAMSALRERMSYFTFLDASSAYSHTTNLDGIVHFPLRNQENFAYTQVFRNGCIEAACVYTHDNEQTIPAQWQERTTLKYVEQYVRALFVLGVSPPLYVFLSLLDVAGYRLLTGHAPFLEAHDFVDRSNLLLPEVTIEDVDFKAGQVLKPAFDGIWHAFNHPNGSQYVNDNGDWIGGRV
jgi:hypothetical protein